MANDMTLAVTIKAVDQFSGRMRGQVTQTLDSFQRKARAASQAASGIGSSFSAAFSAIGSNVAGAALNVAKIIGDKLLGALSRVGSVAVDVFKRMVSGLANVAKWAGIAALGFTGLIARNSINAAMEMETYLAKLQVALKDNAKALEMLDWAKAFAAKTPFEVSGVVDAAARLEMYGLSARKWLPLVGDMAGAMSRDVTDAVEAVADAVMGGGLERLKEFGINSQMLLQYGAATSGQGGVSYQGEDATERLKGALERLMSERYAGGMEKMMGTATGKVSNFKDSLKALYVTIGQALLPVFGKLMAVGQQFFGWLSESGVGERFGQMMAGGMQVLLTWVVQSLPAVIVRIQQGAAVIRKAFRDAFEWVRTNWESGAQTILSWAETIRTAAFSIARAVIVVAEGVEQYIRYLTVANAPLLLIVTDIAYWIAKAQATIARWRGDQEGEMSANSTADAMSSAHWSVRERAASVISDSVTGNAGWREKYSNANNWLDRMQAQTTIPTAAKMRESAQNWWREAHAEAQTLNINLNITGDGQLSEDDKLRQEIIRVATGVMRGEFRQMRWAGGQ